MSDYDQLPYMRICTCNACMDLVFYGKLDLFCVGVYTELWKGETGLEAQPLLRGEHVSRKWALTTLTIFKLCVPMQEVMQHMLRDPVVQNTRLMPTPETEEEGAGSYEGEESENPLVGPGITITQPDKIQPIKVPVPLVHVTCIHNLYDNNNTIS